MIHGLEFEIGNWCMIFIFFVETICKLIIFEVKWAEIRKVALNSLGVHAVSDACAIHHLGSFH
jgi:hypothetical protein